MSRRTAGLVGDVAHQASLRFGWGFLVIMPGTFASSALIPIGCTDSEVEFDLESPVDWKAPMEIHNYLNVLRRRWFSIALITIIGIVLAFVFTAAAPRIYTATAQNFVALSSASSDSDNPLSGAQFAAQRVKSYTEIVSSPEVLDPVIKKLNLPYTSQQLANQVSVTNPAQTVLLLVTASDGSAIQASEIANAVSTQLGKVIEVLETPRKKGATPVKVTLVEPATPPSAPSSPRTTLNLALGLLLGLAVGLGWAFLREALDRTIKTSEELKSLTGLPILGRIALDKDVDKNHLSALDTASPRSEGFRTIRASLDFVSVDSPLKAIVVTSGEPGAGKSTVSVNLAIAIAQTGKRVCILEADLRRPKVLSYLGMPSGPGSTDVLSQQVPLETALVDWNRGFLKVLGQGTMPPNPSELLGSVRMKELVADLKNRFDIVIVDTPPTLAVSDAAIMAADADGVILVTRFGASTKETVGHAMETLTQVETPVVGTVLNAVPAKKKYGYDAYGYGYGGYESEAPPKVKQSRKEKKRAKQGE